MTGNTSLAPLRVLVVDDEPLMCWAVGEILRLGGHTVIETGSARAALDAIAANADAIDVVFLDFRLPDSKDLMLLTVIRQLLPDSAVVLMTAYGSSDLTSAACALGAYRVVSKPFDIQDVEPLLREAYAAARQ
jgi:two-component system nitrogen regulation response regulator GlnG